MLQENADLTKSLHIDGHEYRFGQWPADKAFRVLAELSACVGEALHLKDLAGGESDDAQRLQLLTTAIRSALMGIGSDPERSLRLVKRLTTDGVFCDDQQLNDRVFLTHFQGNMPLLMQVARGALEAHYANFFSFLATWLPVRPKPPASAPSNTAT